MTDKALVLLVTRAQSGDTRAFDALVRRFQDTAFAYLWISISERRSDRRLGLASHAAIWQTTHDRETVLALLRESRPQDDRDMTPLFLERVEFADVHEDPEFLRAIRRG